VSSFSGLNIGLSSLYAQRAGLELTGHNVANANTEGYSRQRVGLAADGGPLTPALHSTWEGAGNGVTITGFDRMRDVFLESRALQERGEQSRLATGSLVLSRVESIFAEPGDSAVRAQLDDFWAGWSDVANKPTEEAPRNQLLQRAQTVAAGLNAAMDSLESQRTSFREQLSVTVTDANTTAASIAEYNRAIVAAVQGGGSPNDLKDQRDLLVQKLGEMVGATVKQGKDGSVDVFVGGAQLVAGRNVGSLAVAGTITRVTPAAAPGAETPPAVTVTVGGAAAGLINGIDNVLPRYTQGLEEVMERLTQDVNEQHLKGSTSTGAAGTALFEVTGKRLQVLLTQPGDIAASATAGGTTTGDAGGGNASKLAAIAGRGGGADVIYRGLVVQLGVEAQTAIRRTDIQSGILAQVDAAREAQSGVNLDEEMTNMLAFQRAYEGAARFVTAVDQMLDTLINRTGLVGR
jgi:flagellar hook-associated protein 1 FlgK